MYADASKTRQAFWTAFGKYLSPLPNSEGVKINWINYHTGFKHVYFRMEATNSQASISIQLSHPDEIQRELFYERLKQMRPLLLDALEEEWTWEPKAQDGSGKEIVRISRELHHVNVYKQEDWPAIISFLKPRIVALDRFWNEVKDALEDLR
jgi:hypothetical protein